MPSRLGRYAVRRRIGSGGFATVWLAYDEHLDSPVAVKVLADNWTEDHHIRQRFLEEGRYLRRVDSPYVVSVYDAGELEDGRPYLVMSYADQGTLADRLEVSGLSPVQALEVVRQVGAGLQALHDRGIVHRDVKPANVLFRSVGEGSVGREARAMVGDLGLGRALDVSSRLTLVGGTPSYVAPEQARAESPDARADQYSLAALTYVLLVGRTPYSHGSLGAAADPGPPPPLSTPERPFPEAVEEVVRRGLARDREDRFPSVEEYVGALARALGDASGIPRDEPGAAAALPLDPDLTQPGQRPTAPHPRTASPVPAEVPSDSASSGPARRRRRVAVLVALGVAALGAGGIGGYVAGGRTAATTVLIDSTGTISVEVPTSWVTTVADRSWDGGEPGGRFPALSVGADAAWAEAGSAAEGVFLGVLARTRVPAVLPKHPECSAVDAPVNGGSDLGRSLTQVSTGCPGGVTVESVVSVADDRLLWIQIRSADRATANRVLDSVDTHGL